MPFFSVIIPTYNRAAVLREALDSVFAQTFADYEVIVVDDGSTDDTASVLAEYGQRVRLFRQANQGPGAARNTGIANALGDFLAFLDSDDLWFPWTLESYASVLVRHAKLAIVLGRAMRFSNRADLFGITASPVKAPIYRDFLTSGQRPVFFGTSYAVIKRGLFVHHDRFLRCLFVFEDQDLGLRLGTCAGCAVVEAPVTVAYRNTPGSLTQTASLAAKGIQVLIEKERSDSYPGGAERRWERRNYIAFSVRSLSLGLLRDAMLKEAWAIYWRCFFWHVRLGRWRYLLGFPLLALKHLAQRFASAS